MSDSSSNRSVFYEENENIGMITIDRPKALNALSLAVIAEIDACLETLLQRENPPRCLIIRGGGEKAFIAGANIAEMQPFTGKEGAEFAETAHKTFRKLECFPSPVIAEIQGYTLGGGAEIAAACDIRIASERAVFAFPETTLGITPGFGGTFRLARLVGLARAKEMIFTGRRVKAEEALRIGLVNSVVPAEELHGAVMKMAKMIAGNAPYAVRAAKRAISEEYGMQPEEALAFETSQFASCFDTEDQKEGMLAFLEKREHAPYTGR